MKEWFVVSTHHNSEDLAIRNLERKGFQTYCPKYFRTISHARKIKKVLRPLFPKYIFVSFDRKKDNWLNINFLRGINSLIMVNRYITSLPNFFIDNLKKYELNKGIINICDYITSTEDQKNFNFLISKKKLINGLYTGIKKKNQVKLLINLFGRDLFCWVSNKKLEA